jgi:hypothetical protein
VVVIVVGSVWISKIPITITITLTTTIHNRSDTAVAIFMPLDAPRHTIDGWGLVGRCHDSSECLDVSLDIRDVLGGMRALEVKLEVREGLGKKAGLHI